MAHGILSLTPPCIRARNTEPTQVLDDSTSGAFHQHAPTPVHAPYPRRGWATRRPGMVPRGTRVPAHGARPPASGTTSPPTWPPTTPPSIAPDQTPASSIDPFHANYGSVMLQGFHWRSCNARGAGPDRRPQLVRGGPREHPGAGADRRRRGLAPAAVALRLPRGIPAPTPVRPGHKVRDKGRAEDLVPRAQGCRDQAHGRHRHQPQVSRVSRGAKGRAGVR